MIEATPSAATQPGVGGGFRRLHRAVAARASLGLLVPLIAVLGISLLAPLVQTFLASLDEGVETYGSILSSPLYTATLARTLRVSAEAATICLLLAYPLAAFVSGRAPRTQQVLLLFVFTPLWISSVVRTYAWVVILRPRGVLDQGAATVGLPAPSDALFQTEVAVLVGMTHILLPIAVIPVFASFRALDRNLIRAARSLGADSRRQWLRVVLPLTAPGAVAAWFLVFLLSLGFYITPAILGGRRSLMIATLIDEQVRNLELARASALAVVLLVSSLGVLAVSYGLVEAARRRGLAR